MYVKGTVSPMPGFAGLRGRGLGRLRGRVRVLGCSSCSAKKLGQDSSIYDIQYGGGNTEQYDTGVSYASPVFGPPAPTAAQVAYDTTVTSGSTPNPTYAFQPLPTTHQVKFFFAVLEHPRHRVTIGDAYHTGYYRGSSILVV